MFTICHIRNLEGFIRSANQAPPWVHLRFLRATVIPNWITSIGFHKLWLDRSATLPRDGVPQMTIRL